MTEQAVLSAESLHKTFGSGHARVQAVNDVSLQIRKGELVIVTGPSGSGKTTLLSMLGALLRPDAGRIVIDGHELTAKSPTALARIRASHIGFVFQAFNLLEPLSVEENVLFPAHLTAGGRAGAKSRADELIERLGLGERRRALPGTLSGGEKQRVAIARALINQPMLILADEPTGNLDSARGQEVMMILHDIARDEGRAVIMVTHDPRVEDVADRILWLEDGALRDRKAEQHDWAHDPVCGMRVDAWRATQRAEHGGQAFVFCSARCRQRFLDDPERYVDNVPTHA